jgi:hypothetical protein
MTQRKVIIVPTIRATQNTESKRVELVPFTGDETDLIVAYIRDPKAFLENNESETLTVSMESLLSRKYADQVFGSTYCGLTFPATAQDVLNTLKALSHNTGVEAFINDLIGEHVNDSSFYTIYKVVDSDVESITIQYLKDHGLIGTLLRQTSRYELDADKFKDGGTAVLADFIPTHNQRNKIYQQWRELFIDAIPTVMFRRSPIQPVTEFTPGVRHDLLMELAVNPGLVKEIFLTAFRNLASKAKSPDFQFSDFLRSVTNVWGLYGLRNERKNSSINWDCSEDVEQLAKLLKNILMFDEIQAYGHLLRTFSWGLSPIVNQALTNLSAENSKFYNQYSQSPDGQWHSFDRLQPRSSEEAEEFAIRYERILKVISETELKVYYL